MIPSGKTSIILPPLIRLFFDNPSNFIVTLYWTISPKTPWGFERVDLFNWIVSSIYFKFSRDIFGFVTNLPFSPNPSTRPSAWKLFSYRIGFSLSVSLNGFNNFVWTKTVVPSYGGIVLPFFNLILILWYVLFTLDALALSNVPA